MSEPNPEPVAAPETGTEVVSRRGAVRGGTVVAAIVLLLLALGAGRTMLSRMANAKVLESNAAEHAVQYVKTTFAKSSDSGQTLALPGTLQGAQQAPIAARATGYLKRWTKDIGACCATWSRSRSSTRSAAPLPRRTPTSPPPMPTSSGCARCRASPASPRRSRG